MSSPPARFSFMRTDRGTARYTCGERSIDLEVEPGVNGLLIVYLSAAKLWTMPVAPLTQSEREAIQVDVESIDTGTFAKLDVC